MRCPNCGKELDFIGYDYNYFCDIWYCEECDEDFEVIDGPITDDDYLDYLSEQQSHYDDSSAYAG